MERQAAARATPAGRAGRALARDAARGTGQATTPRPWRRSWRGAPTTTRVPPRCWSRPASGSQSRDGPAAGRAPDGCGGCGGGRRRRRALGGRGWWRRCSGRAWGPTAGSRARLRASRRWPPRPLRDMPLQSPHCSRRARTPPSLPYKVDTSRPSLRTNWTHFVHPSVLIGHVPPPAGAHPGLTDAAHRNALHRAAQVRARPCTPVEPFTRMHLSGFGAIALPTATRALAARAAPQARAAAHRGAILRACGCSCAPP